MLNSHHLACFKVSALAASLNFSLSLLYMSMALGFMAWSSLICASKFRINSKTCLIVFVGCHFS